YLSPRGGKKPSPFTLWSPHTQGLSSACKYYLGSLALHSALLRKVRDTPAGRLDARMTAFSDGPKARPAYNAAPGGARRRVRLRRDEPALRPPRVAEPRFRTDGLSCEHVHEAFCDAGIPKQAERA